MFDSTKKFSSECDENSHLAVSFQSTKMVVSKRYLSRNLTKNQLEQSVINFEKKTYNGEMSRATKAYLRKKLDAWYMSIRWNNKNRAISKKEKSKKLIFFTLTLSAPQTHSDNEIKRECLNSFIIKMKNASIINHWFWRAEKQRCGNIHFHFISDCYIDKTGLQTFWNEAQERLNYVTEFEKKYGHRTPPSTQIQVIPNDHNVIEYLMKYNTKADKNGTVTGRIWGMSDSLRNLLTPTLDMDTETQMIVNEFSHPGRFNVYQDENCIVVNVCHEERLKYYSLIEKTVLNEYSKANYEYLYCYGIEPIDVIFPTPELKPLEIPEWIIERKKQDFEKQRQYVLF
jgi:hypothetical protein